MNEKVLKTLEYHKILSQLSEYAFSDAAKKRCLSLRPITDRGQIELLQLQTRDALSRLFRCGPTCIGLCATGVVEHALTVLAQRFELFRVAREIGRASCRERV